MQVKLTQWGNGQGVRFTREFLRRAGVSPNDTLEAEIVEGQIVLTPSFRHRSLRERAAAYSHIQTNDRGICLIMPGPGQGPSPQRSPTGLRWPWRP